MTVDTEATTALVTGHANRTGWQGRRGVERVAQNGRIRRRGRSSSSVGIGRGHAAPGTARRRGSARAQPRIAAQDGRPIADNTRTGRTVRDSACTICWRRRVLELPTVRIVGFATATGDTLDFARVARQTIHILFASHSGDVCGWTTKAANDRDCHGAHKGNPGSSGEENSMFLCCH
jgi:hypothetical protein